MELGRQLYQIMSATDRVNQVLASQSPNWNSVSLGDVRYCILSKINRYKELRRCRDQEAGLLAAISDDLRQLFAVVAQKRGQRGVVDLKDAIDELEERAMQSILSTNCC
jgi:hypothetical protein